MKVVYDIFAPRLGDVAEAGRETELQAHHGQASVTYRDRELSPEIARWRPRPCQECKQRAEDKEEVQRGPCDSANCKARLHCYPPRKQSRSRAESESPSAKLENR